MSYSSSTTPADKGLGTEKKPISRFQTVITAIFIGIWCVLISIGIISAVDPVWLQDLNRSGVQGEAGFHRDFGDVYMHRKQYDAAIEQYIIALAIKPDFADVIVNLAVAYIYTDRFEAAEELLKESLELVGSQTGVIYYNLGSLYERLERSRDAIASYQKALGAKMSQWMVYRQLARLYMASGRLEDALEALHETLRIQTDPASGYRDMLYHSLNAYNEEEHGPYIEKLMPQENWDQALAAFDLEIIQSMIRHDSEIAVTHSELSYLYGLSGNQELADHHYLESLKYGPGNHVNPNVA